MGLAKSPRAEHIKHNPLLVRALDSAEDTACWVVEMGSPKAKAQGEPETEEGGAEQVKPGKLTRKTLTTVIK